MAVIHSLVHLPLLQTSVCERLPRGGLLVDARVHELRQGFVSRPRQRRGFLFVHARHRHTAGIGYEPSLHDHLHQIHRVQARREPAGLGAHVDYRLKDPHRLIQHTLCVGDVVAHRQLQPKEVRLEQQISLCVGIVREPSVHLEPARVLNLPSQLGVHLVLVVTHGELVVLCHAAEDAQKLLQGGIRAQTGCEQRDGGVLKVVKARDAPHRRGLQAVVLADRETLRILQLRERVLHQPR